MPIKIEITGDTVAEIVKLVADFSYEFGLSDDAVDLIDEEPKTSAKSIIGQAVVTPTPVVDEPTPVVDELKTDLSGTVFDPELHTGTMTKAGAWRLKKGAATSTPETGTASPQVDTAPVKEATIEIVQVEDDDEFAAFAAAANKTSEPAKAAETERVYTDSDLGSFANQAAQKLGKADGVRDLIAKYVAADAVPHSRNIAAEDRADFVTDLGRLAGLTF